MIATVANFAGRFGVAPKEAERFFKFAVVGAMGFIVDFGVFNILVGPLTIMLDNGTAMHEFFVQFGLTDELVVGLAITLASIISFIAAIISNFLWNRYWTYPDSRTRSIRRQLAQFTLVSVAGILIRVPLIAATHGIFSRFVETIPSLAPYADRIGSNLALMLAVIVVMFWNFFVNRYWTYNDVD